MIFTQPWVDASWFPLPLLPALQRCKQPWWKCKLQFQWRSWRNSWTVLRTLHPILNYNSALVTICSQILPHSNETSLDISMDLFLGLSRCNRNHKFSKNLALYNSFWLILHQFGHVWALGKDQHDGILLHCEDEQSPWIRCFQTLVRDSESI